ncbi:MAG: chorismate-binding protein [Bacteroidetes bacterium]|nr:chorismate-binding protein [Bacteroidota bacterium]
MRSKEITVTDRHMVVQDIIHYYLNLGGSIMYWRKPGSPEKMLLVCNQGAKAQEDISLEDTDPGFVLAPFDPSLKKKFFKADLLFRFKGDHLMAASTTTLPELNLPAKADAPPPNYYFRVCPKETSANTFHELIHASIDCARQQVVEKIVPSKFQEVSLPENFDPVTVFNQLCEKHPHAFVSLVTSPDTGTWIGASPELLVNVDATGQFKTIALAGTQKMKPEVNLKSVSWTQKEIEEQALVSRYIINCFKKIRVREYTEQGPHTVTAGSLLHLKTEYRVDMKEVNFPQMGSVMLKLLHPTSAVCGMPFQPAFDFLKKNEGYDREFYSGYLGPVNMEGESSLYVNLRCMQILEKKVRLYAGAGVTADSDAGQEAEEIETKIKTLSQLIQ